MKLEAERSRLSLESGLTLVELLVVMVLVGVVGGIATTGIVSALQSAAATNERIEALNELEIATQRFARDVRGAEAVLISDTPGSLIRVFVPGEAGVPQPVTYGVLDQALIRVEAGQTVVTEIGNEADDPVFSYFDSTSGFDENREPIASCDTTGCEGLASVRVRLVREVEGRSSVIVETETSIRSVRYGSFVLLDEEDGDDDE